MNKLTWVPDVVIEKVYMKKPAQGVTAVIGGTLMKAGTPLNNSKAVANTENAKYLVAEDYIFYNDPTDNAEPVKLITAGYVDINKAEAAWGKSYEDEAVAALATAGIVLVDGALSAANVGAATTSDIPTIPVAENQADSTAETLAALVTDFNGLLAKLKEAGLMEADAEEPQSEGT